MHLLLSDGALSIKVHASDRPRKRQGTIGFGNTILLARFNEVDEAVLSRAGTQYLAFFQMERLLLDIGYPATLGIPVHLLGPNLRIRLLDLHQTFVYQQFFTFVYIYLLFELLLFLV